MNHLLMLLVPVFISGVAFLVFKATITWKEFLLSLGLGVVTALVGWQIASWGSLRSSQNLNGRITEKVSGTQKCCHCQDVCTKHETRTTCVSRNKNGDCTRTEDRDECTRHEEKCDHFHDYYWELQTSVGNISVQDCSGADSPPSVWSNSKVGEPASVESSYKNYLLADKDSLYEHAPMERYESSIPEYPRVQSLYRINHVVGLTAPPAFIDAIREINADLGPTNQVDVTVLLTGEVDPSYAQAVEAKWLYGPKNSLTIVLGLRGDTIQWVRVVTFSKVEMLKVRLRDQLQGLSIGDPKVPALIRSEVQGGFKRTAMKDFEYLASTASPDGWILALLFVFEVLLSIGLTYWVHVKDVFGDERRLLDDSRFNGKSNHPNYPAGRVRRR